MNPATNNQKTKPKLLEEAIKTNDKFIPFCVITETHLQQSIYDAEVEISDYTIYRSDRVGRKCGGTAVYVHQSIPVNNVEKYSDSVCEAVLMYIKELNLVIAGVYRPPSGHANKDIHTSFRNLLNSFEAFLKRIDNPQILFMGDLNLPSINWSTESITSDRGDKKCAELFLDFMDKHLLTQHVKETTRKDQNTLDLIVSNIPAMIHSVIVEKVNSKFSDHDMVHCYITELFRKGKPPEKPYTPTHPFDKLNFKRANWQEIRDKLKEVNWSSL